MQYTPQIFILLTLLQTVLLKLTSDAIPFAEYLVDGLAVITNLVFELIMNILFISYSYFPTLVEGSSGSELMRYRWTFSDGDWCRSKQLQAAWFAEILIHWVAGGHPGGCKIYTKTLPYLSVLASRHLSLIPLHFACHSASGSSPSQKELEAEGPLKCQLCYCHQNPLL